MNIGFNIKLLLTAVITMLLFSVYGQSESELFQLANEEYKNGNHSKAEEMYLQLAESGIHSFDLLYNLGNSHFKQRQYAEAILSYERALKIRPGDANARYNLNITNNFVKDHIPQRRQLFFIEWWRFLSEWLSTAWWLVIHILLFLPAAALTGYSLLTKREGRKLPGFRLALIFFVFSILTLALAIQRNYDQHVRKEAIIMTESVSVKSGPGISSVSLGEYHAGTKVMITSENQEWYEIKTADGHIGWIRKDEATVI